MQTISRKGNFDSGHRVMNERMKCFNVHGHTYLYQLHFEFENMAEIGYAIDFKEIKRVGCQWIDDLLDHGMILNPHDYSLIDTTRELGSKLWLMSLNGPSKYCNPTVENIAKEVFLAMELLFDENYDKMGLKIHRVTINETPNCWTDCMSQSISYKERLYFREQNGDSIRKYAKDKGVFEYDDRKI